LSAIQSAARNRGSVAIFSTLNSFLKIPIFLFLVNLIQNKSLCVLLAYSYSGLAVIILQLIYLRNKKYEIPKKNYRKIDWESKLLKFALPFSKWGFFTWLHQISDKLSLQAFGSLESVGYYSAFYQLTFAPISILTNVLINLISPIIYLNNVNKKESLRESQIAFLVLIITAICFFTSLFAHSFIFKLFVSDEYQKISYLMPWGILASGIYSCAQFLSIKLISDLNVHLMLPLKIGTALGGILLNIVGVIYFGIIGLVIAELIFAIIYFYWMFLLVKPFTKKISTI
jgi:O-antigen/teichoic acid export membrane protein